MFCSHPCVVCGGQHRHKKGTPHPKGCSVPKHRYEWAHKWKVISKTDHFVEPGVTFGTEIQKCHCGKSKTIYYLARAGNRVAMEV